MTSRARRRFAEPVTWDPDAYLRYADERSRPFGELLARVAAQAPTSVADLGCGPGNLTASLARRWPDAEVVGLDSSPAMVDRARADHGARVRFAVGDLREWAPARPVDVLVSNATLQWVPEHRELLPRLLLTVAAGGWLAFQVPANRDEPSHRVPLELAAEPPFAAFTEGAPALRTFDALTYLTDLAGLACEVDAWETTYLHVLRGPDPVFEWVSGTSARPLLAALPGQLREVFAAQLRHRLRTAYPAGPLGTVLPFRRVFVVARRA